ncbi:exodeoxyribonuclease VII large subunit [Hyphococcus sp.]|uniref:exodeoxyribonuclease VII large subunit n=1 Tax=Hyphococcus sp. TaxID=2038636 RepID=UPI0020872880|nr:MAG: exodeoxyribonuclease 7 large subunit [Marinicaulis sp.]
MSESTIGNIHEYTVSELSGAVKRAIEDNFGLVRVKGELGRVTRAASGHVYLDLKDEKSVISSVMWKGTAGRLSINPEQGMEVVATGRMSTFPGQSRYQLIIDSLEPAGVGALMALFEERKKKLAAEGLFAPERKKPLPFLPDVIGVVTSPSGAVIRDILHRLRERFPRHVIVWPTVVQGRGAEDKIADAIRGFNALEIGGDIPRPDVLIVARGGGSLEDLWCFNEEVVARAAAASEIPLISAVGHETDTTLIDYVADKRAPTPTAAAEIAVPVRSELRSEVLNKERRFTGAVSRSFETRRAALVSAARGLGRPEDILGAAGQRLDRAADGLRSGLRALLDASKTHFTGVAARLNRNLFAGGFELKKNNVDEKWRRITDFTRRMLSDRAARLAASVRVLSAVSYQNVLERGFALVRDSDGGLLRRAAETASVTSGEIQFADGARAISFTGAVGPQKTAKNAEKSKASKSETRARPRQPRLFD